MREGTSTRARRATLGIRRDEPRTPDASRDWFPSARAPRDEARRSRARALNSRCTRRINTRRDSGVALARGGLHQAAPGHRPIADQDGSCTWASAGFIARISWCVPHPQLPRIPRARPRPPRGSVRPKRRGPFRVGRSQPPRGDTARRDAGRPLASRASIAATRFSSLRIDLARIARAPSATATPARFTRSLAITSSTVSHEFSWPARVSFSCSNQSPITPTSALASPSSSSSAT